MKDDRELLTAYLYSPFGVTIYMLQNGHAEQDLPA